MYQYRLRKRAIPKVAKAGLQFAKDRENLTGRITGIRASDLEERLWNASFKTTVSQRTFHINFGDFGRVDVQLDFLFRNGAAWKAVEVDDTTFVHKGEREYNETLIKDQKRRTELAKKGVSVDKILHATDKDLRTPDAALRWARENL